MSDKYEAFTEIEKASQLIDECFVLNGINISTGISALVNTISRTLAFQSKTKRSAEEAVEKTCEALKLLVETYYEDLKNADSDHEHS